MASLDAPFLADMFIRGMDDFEQLPARLMQGMVNALVLMRLATGDLLRDPEIAAVGGRATSITAQAPGFYGISLGGIMGALYVSVSTQVDKGVLLVRYTVTHPAAVQPITLGGNPQRILSFQLKMLTFAIPMNAPPHFCFPFMKQNNQCRCRAHHLPSFCHGQACLRRWH